MAFNRSSVCICAQTRKNVSTGAAILLIFIFNTTSVVFVFHFKPYTHQFRSCKMSHFKTHDTCFDILYLTQCHSDVFKCLKCTNMCSLLTHISLISILSNLDSDEIKKRANYDFAKVSCIRFLYRVSTGSQSVLRFTNKTNSSIKKVRDLNFTYKTFLNKFYQE